MTLPVPRRALIVDDDPVSRVLVARSFRDAGFDAWEAPDGATALGLADGEPFACIVLDLHMPGLSGFDVCRRLRAMPAYRNTPILIQTGLDDHGSIDAAFEAGATDYLTKPVNRALLAQRLRFLMKTAMIVEELADKRAQLDEALELARLGHWEFHARDRTITLSEAAVRVLGGPALQPLATLLGALADDDRDALERQLSALARGEASAATVVRWQTPDRGERVVQFIGRTRTAADGRAVGAAGSVQDVTDREAIIETMRLWSKVIETTTEGMLLLDRDWRALQVNAAFAKITGLDLAALQRDVHAYFDEPFLARIRPALVTGGWQGERTTTDADGLPRHHWINVGVLHDGAGRPAQHVVMVSDISALRRSQSRLDYLARHDTLTGLPNRAALIEAIDRQMNDDDPSRASLALLYVDLDRFKNVNDALGQDWGDRVLLAVVERLRAHLPAQALLGRPESDEFMVMLPALRSPADAAALAEAMLGALATPLRVEHYEVAIGACIGIVLHPQHGRQVDDLVKFANIAMHRAKERGRGRFQVYSEAMSAEIAERLSLEAQIRAALARGEFELHYQPKVHLASGRVVGAEALIRWPHPRHGAIAPGRFVPVAEESGLIAEIGRWVMGEAAAQAARWHAEGVGVGHVAVNIAGPQVWRGDFLDHIESLLRRHRLDPALLQVEITETLIMREGTRDETVSRLEALRDLGLKLAIDDFGTGYSSLARLKRLPVASLKIDQSFVRGVVDDPNDAAIVRAIIAMARTLGLVTVAEGVETAAQREWLRREGCDLGQGYLFGRALPADAFARLVRDGRAPDAGDARRP